MENKYHLIITGAGESKRFGQDKLFLKISGKTLLEWTISNFNKINFEKKVLVLRKEKIKNINIRKNFKDFLIVEGGEKRAISVYNGFMALFPENEDFILIHDGARPFVSYKLIKNLMSEIKKESGVIPVLPVKETLKKINKNYIEKTVDREGIFSVQTPQIYKAETLKNAYKMKREIWENLTDESQLLEILKIPVKTIEGSPLNIKITYKEDLENLKFILKK